MTTRPGWRTFVALATLCGACDPAAPADAGPDAALDSGPTRDAGRDAGPMCEPTCASTETCCADEDGTLTCAQLRSDPRHCGLCTIDCVASHRGDACSASQCSCGTSRLGCTGNRQSWCCPPREGSSEGYCTDLDRSAADCGACGVRCDLRVSDRCDGGRCLCGTERGPCEGTPESICCADGVDVACADTTTNRVHCGACNNRCTAIERCEASTCTEGASCAGGCALGEVCCNGSCCSSRARCLGGVCMERASDAGAGDGGGADAGVDGG